MYIDITIVKVRDRCSMFHVLCCFAILLSDAVFYVSTSDNQVLWPQIGWISRWHASPCWYSYSHWCMLCIHIAHSIFAFTYAFLRYMCLYSCTHVHACMDSSYIDSYSCSYVHLCMHYAHIRTFIHACATFIFARSFTFIYVHIWTYAGVFRCPRMWISGYICASMHA